MEFGPFLLNEVSFELTRGGKSVSIEPQSLRLLVYLIRHRERVVSRDDLVEVIWQGRAVSDWAISGAVKAVRIALNDTKREKTIVKTIHSRGYRFVADVISTTPDQQSDKKVILLVRAFQTPGKESGLEYLAEGITEDIIFGLSRNKNMSVLSHNITRAIASGTPPPIYGVTNIVEGSVRRLGETIRINIAILDGDGQGQNWAETFDLTDDSLLTGHDLIGQRLTAVLLPDQNTNPSARRGTSIPAAYDEYQKGRYAYFRYEPKAFVEALGHFSKAAEIDPGFANAYAQQAYCRTTLYVFGLPVSDKTLDPAEALARKAIESDGTSALGYARLGWVLGYRGRPDETAAAFDAAVNRDPDNAEVYLAYGETMNRLAQPEKAEALLDTVFSKDSYLPPSWEFPQGHTQILLEEHDRAIQHFRSVLDRVERFIPARVQLVRALWEIGDEQGATEMAATIREFAPKYSLAHAERMFPYPVEREKKRLIKALEGAGLQ